MEIGVERDKVSEGMVVAVGGHLLLKGTSLR